MSSVPVSRRNRSSRLWLGSITVIGALLTALAAYHITELNTEHWLALALAVSLTSCLGTRASLKGLRIGGLTITASDAFILMAIVFVGVWAAILLGVVDALVVLSRRRVGGLDRRLFNIAQMAVTAFVGACVFELFKPTSEMSAETFWLFASVALFFSGLFYFLTNFTLLTIAMALHSGERLARLWRGNLPVVSPALLLNLMAGLGFSLPLLVPVSSQLMWVSALGAVGLVGHVFYTRRIQERGRSMATSHR